MSLRVFILDDHEMVRRGLVDLIDAQPDMEIVGEAATVHEARARITATDPDVALLDVRLPDGSGIDVCRDLRSTGCRTQFLMLTAYDDEQALYAAVIAGASGYFLKDIRGPGLIESITLVAGGKSLLSAGQKQQAGKALKAELPSDLRLANLSLRERQILALIADGLTNRQIGERLAIAEKTVKNYVSGLLGKLGLERRTQAAVFALRANDGG